MAASAAQVFTGLQGGRGDNSGSAAILDTHQDFLPYAMNLAQERRNEAKLLRAKQEAADKEFKGLVGKIVPQTTWKYSQVEIGEDAKKARDFAVQAKMKGEDPTDPYSESGRQLASMLDEMNGKAYIAKSNEKAVLAAIAEAQKGGYDMDHFNKFMKGLDGKNTVEQAEWIANNRPLRKNILDIEVIDKTSPELFRQTIEKGMRTDTNEWIREEDYAPILESYLTTDEGIEHFEQGVEDGKWKDETGYVKYMTNLAQKKNPGKKTVSFDEGSRPVSPGDTEDKRDLEVTASYNNAFPTEKGKTNTVTFTPKNQNMKPVVLFDGQNQYIATGQLSIHPSKDGKSYVIEADVYDKDAVAEDVPIDPNTGKPDTAALLTSLVSKGSSKKRMMFPIDHRPGETGNENYKILSDRAPQEIQNYIGRDIGGDGVKATGKEKSKPKYPLPKGKPARGKKNGVWYIWDETTGQYVQE